MRFVLDACVGLKWILPEDDSAKALNLREDFCRQVHELIAPDTFPPEVAHALTRAERKGVLSREDGASGFLQILAILPEIHESLPLLPRAYELSSQHRIGAFDCIYVALAEREQCPLITSDERLIRTLPGFPIVLLSSL